MRNAHGSVLLAAGVSLSALVASPRPAPANPLAPPAHCAKPSGLPRVRTAGQLVVESPPRAKPERWLRLRTHRSPPDRAGTSYWEGPEVPSFVALAAGNMELELLDPIAGGYLALYRSTGGSLGPNDSYAARLFSCSGQTLASVSLNSYFSRPDQLEVQDIRYADGTLYFNEACQTYSRDAGGRCSALVAVNPLTKRRLWRSAPLVSNNVIRIEGGYVIAGYGFTAEKDWLHVVRRSDGRVMQRKSLSSNHFGLEVLGAVLDVETGGKWASYRMDGFDGSTPRLSSLGTHATRGTPTATMLGAGLRASVR